MERSEKTSSFHARAQHCHSAERLGPNPNPNPNLDPTLMPKPNPDLPLGRARLDGPVGLAGPWLGLGLGLG